MLDDLRDFIQSRPAVTMVSFCEDAGISRQSIANWQRAELPKKINQSTYDKLVIALYGEDPLKNKDVVQIDGSTALLLEFLQSLPEENRAATINKFIAENYKSSR